MGGGDVCKYAFVSLGARAKLACPHRVPEHGVHRLLETEFMSAN